MLRVAALITLIGTLSVWTPAVANPLSVPAELSSPEVGSDQAILVSLRPAARRLTVPDARWDAKPGRKSWTLASLKALRSHAGNLPDIVPKDIANYCPAYPSASREQREAFWVGLVSALAWHESTNRPDAVGGGGLWYGLTQILPSTARLYKCQAKSGGDLKDPEDNLSCALRIMSKTVARDKVISANMRGVAADWGPFHSARKRQDMMAWTRSQSYCQGIARSLKPVARPEQLMAQARQAEQDRLMAQFRDLRPQARTEAVIARVHEERLPYMIEAMEVWDKPIMSTQSEG